MREVEVDEPVGLLDYEAWVALAEAVARLRAEAAPLVRGLKGRRVWMVNSTAQGGGVAEMLPKLVSSLRELGVDARWVVMKTDEPAFFVLTKKLHTALHGVGGVDAGEAERALYEQVSGANADAFAARLSPGDVVVVHDPQPIAIGALLKRRLGVTTVWRCHIGAEEETAGTRAAWRFLEPWAASYDAAVFSLPVYVPPFLRGKASVIAPAIDPLSHKNRELSPHKLMGILCNAGLAPPGAPVLTPPWEDQAKRLLPDGSWTVVSNGEDPGLPFRPWLLQVSRWDRLKGFGPLLDAFVALKARAATEADERHRRRLDLLRLVLAGPDPSGVSDDPEGLAVLGELSTRYRALPAPLQRDVLLTLLPMRSRKENALMVNALQRHASLVVQNSLREGFGLTATEAMWKRVPVVTSKVGGLAAQVRDGVDGRLVDDPEDTGALADALDGLLREPHLRDALGRNGQRRVVDEFLVFTQLRRWLALLARLPARAG